MEPEKHIRHTLPPLALTSPFAVLSTIDSEGYPDTRAMLNLRNEALYPHLKSLYGEDENPLAIYLTTNTSSCKVAEVQVCSRAGLYFFDGENYLGAYLRGKIEVVEELSFKRRAWGPGWEQYYPGGVEDADFSLLRFVPDRIKTYACFSVQEKNL